MTKRIWLISALFLTGCFGGSAEQSTSNGTLFSWETTTITRGEQQWQLQVPNTWEKLAPQPGVLFMARNGDENFAIMGRDQSEVPPKQQILGSAQEQFTGFNLVSQSDDQWQFTGKLDITAPERTFWQKIQPAVNEPKFLLLSCSQHTSSPTDSFCPQILGSWKTVEAE